MLVVRLGLEHVTVYYTVAYRRAILCPLRAAPSRAYVAVSLSRYR
jgi:hypothetical protein